MTPEQLKVLKLTAELLVEQYPRAMAGSKASALAVALIDLDDEQEQCKRCGKINRNLGNLWTCVECGEVNQLPSEGT